MRRKRGSSKYSEVLGEQVSQCGCCPADAVSTLLTSDPASWCSAQRATHSAAEEKRLEKQCELCSGAAASSGLSGVCAGTRASYEGGSIQNKEPSGAQFGEPFISDTLPYNTCTRSLFQLRLILKIQLISPRRRFLFSFLQLSNRSTMPRVL